LSSVVEREFPSSRLNSVLMSRHVATTDVIKELVITEEGSVAKGIRRVVAVTGHDAYEVQRKGKEFDAKLETIRGLQGKDKEAAMKPFLTVCSTFSSLGMC
jgi:alanyl-tRNA synthetase